MRTLRGVYLIRWASSLLVVVGACGAQPSAGPPPWLLIVPQGDSRLQVALEVPEAGPPMAAVGDTLRLRLREEHCRLDVCTSVTSPVPAPAGWVSENPRIADIDSLGLLRPVAPGRVRILVPWHTATLWRVFAILPPVAAIRWDTPQVAVRVGDTVRLGATAYDSSGGVVARLPLAYGKYISGGSIGWPQPDPTDSMTYVLVPREVGEQRFFVRLAHRSDSLDVRVNP